MLLLYTQLSPRRDASHHPDYLSYYHTDAGFRGDLERFLKLVFAQENPRHKRFPMQKAQAFQEHHLRPEPLLLVMSSRDFPYFIVALYFSVLFEDVMATQFRMAYPRFQSMTQYPRYSCSPAAAWHEKCSANCMLPYLIWHRRAQEIPEVFQQAMPVMKKELELFCEAYLPDLAAASVWSIVEQSYPEKELALLSTYGGSSMVEAIQRLRPGQSTDETR